MPVCTFDIETLGWDEPIAIGAFDGFHYEDFLKHSESDDIIWQFLCYLKEKVGPSRFYAHNAAYFDNRFILNSLVRHNQKISLEAGLGVLKWLDAGISFRDSFQLLRTSLAKACEIFNIEEKLNWDHESTKPIWKMSLDERRVFRSYLERDCRSLSKAYSAFAWELIRTFDIKEPGQTLAQTSLRIFDTYHSLETIESNLEFDIQIRGSLYGARNEVYTRFGENINHYDIRSMYVSCYDAPVPVGKMNWVYPDMERGVIARAEVKVPEDMYLPPLPFHYNNKLVFPVGKFEGWWNMEELRYAEELGVKVHLKAQLDGELKPILDGFGKRISGLRRDSVGDIGRLWKLLGLQLVGKFAQSRSRTAIKHVDTIEDLEGSVPIDEGEQYVEVDRKMNGRLLGYIARVTKPAITSKIRAIARIRHHRVMMEALGLGDIYYCDTDSLFCDADLQVGPDAGDLSLIGVALKAFFIMNKFYGYTTPQGILRQKSSGFSGVKLTEDQFADLLKGKIIKMQNLSPNLSAPTDIIKGEEITSRVKFRTIRTPHTQQNRILDGGVTRPIVVG